MAASADIQPYGSPQKRRKSFRSKPRRSLCLTSSSDDWSRFKDGFSEGHHTAERKVRRSSLKGRPTIILPPTPGAEGKVDIDDHSSSDEDTFEDVQPLSPLEPDDVHGTKFSFKPTHIKHQSCVKKPQDDMDKEKTDIQRACGSLRPISERIDVDDGSDRVFSSQSSIDRSQAYSITGFDSPASVKSGLESSTESPVISAESIPDIKASKQEVSKVRSSEWLNQLQWRQLSPPREHIKERDIRPEDSAKKKKQRLIPGGLAERMQKIAMRKKSALTIFTHRVSTNTKIIEANRKDLVVKVLDINKEMSMMVTHCEVIRAQTQNTSWGRGTRIHVLFSLATVERVNLQKGVIVQILPPWQTMALSTGGYALLCTDFCRCLTCDQLTTDTTLTNTNPPTQPQSDWCTAPLIGNWKCTCSLDPFVPTSDCPSHQIGCSSPRSVPYTPCYPPAAGPGQLSDSQIPGQSQDSQETTSSSILQEMASQRSVGWHARTIKAVVQRIFLESCQRSSSMTLPCTWTPLTKDMGHSHKPKVSILVQDKAKVYHLLVLPSRWDQDVNWKELVEHGEGKWWQFNDLRLQRRLTKSRFPNLFHIIKTLRPSEDSMPYIEYNSQQSRGKPFKEVAQTVCYQFMAASCRNPSHPHTQSSPLPLYCPPYVLKLTDLSQQTRPHPRFTLICKVFYIHPQDDRDLIGGVRYWYVVDCSIRPPFTAVVSKVTVHQRCCMSPSVLKELQTQGPVLILKDVAVRKGQYICDEYTRLFTTSSVCGVHQHLTSACDALSVTHLQSITPFLPSLSLLSTGVDIGDLVTVSGKVTDVDEDTAFSWQSCDVCGSDQLELHRALYYCTECERPVKCPSTKMNLEVYVNCDIQGEYQVPARIKLLQTTIERLLPRVRNKEHYDMQVIMNKHVGPLPCYVSAVVEKNPHDTRKDTGIQLLEIPLAK